MRLTALRGGVCPASGWLFCIVFLSGLLSGQAQKLGDVNRDDTIDIADAVLIMNHLQGTAALTTNQLALPLADVDTNGAINFADFQRVVDVILGRRAVQDFDVGLLDYDDGDGLTFLEEFAAGTNPYLWDTFGNGLNDEVNLHSAGMVVLAQPPLELFRAPLAGDGGAVLLAQPPVEVYRPNSGAVGTGIVLAQPPVEAFRSTTSGNASGVVSALPPVEVLRTTLGSGAGALVAQPPLEAILPNQTSGGTLLAQPPLTVTRE